MTTMIAERSDVTGFVTELEVEAFNFGDCWRLALAVQEQYGFPVAFYAGIPAHSAGTYKCDETTMWCHAFNALPDGRFLDVNGISSIEEMDKKWHEFLWLDDGATPHIATPADDELALMLSEQEAMYLEVDADATARTLVNTFFPQF